MILCLISFVTFSTFFIIQTTVQNYTKDIELVNNKIKENFNLFLNPGALLKNLDVKLDELFNAVETKIQQNLKNTMNIFLIAEEFEALNNRTVNRSFDQNGMIF